MKWIVVANAAKASIYNTHDLNDSWSLVVELSHPDSRKNISDMYRDEPNVTSSSSRSGKDVIEPPTDLEQKEEVIFANEVSDFLEENHHQHNFDQLYLIAAPSFLGTLRPLLHKGIEDKIVTSIDKNLAELNTNELQQRLLKHLD